MSLDNPWFWAALLGVVLVFHLELAAAVLNLAQFRKPLPETVRALYDADKLERCREYHWQSTRVEVCRDAFMLALLLVFWLGGGFGWLHELVRALEWGAVSSGVLTVGALLLARQVIDLPFSWWQTFRVEAEFGFNRTTPGTYVADLAKTLLLMLVLGAPLLALVLWFFETRPWAAFWAWLSVALFSLLMTWLSPRLIMPLFLRFEPLPAGPLRESIFELAARLRFPVAEVSVVDGSRRSTKANAFFAGFGRYKRIALFDTLVDKHEPDELLAVLAHEIGHAKRGHVPRHLLLGLLESAVMFAALAFALRSPGLFSAFGVGAQPVGLGLVFFSLVYRPVSLLLSVLSSALSRRHEFEADAFACEAMGSPAPLESALKKLSSDHLAHPQPHPLAVRLHHSHPPLAQRLAAVRQAVT